MAAALTNSVSVPLGSALLGALVGGLLTQVTGRRLAATSERGAVYAALVAQLGVLMEHARFAHPGAQAKPPEDLPDLRLINARAKLHASRGVVALIWEFSEAVGQVHGHATAIMGLE